MQLFKLVDKAKKNLYEIKPMMYTAHPPFSQVKSIVDTPIEATPPQELCKKV